MVINTSDANEKSNINELKKDDMAKLINALRPVEYKFNGRTRNHYGLIAQEVESAVESLGIDKNLFAPWIKDDETKLQGLRYSEFLAPMLCVIQKLLTQMTEVRTLLDLPS